MSSRDLVVAAAGSSGAAKDDYFKNVSLLLSGDGTNGAQNNTFLDSSTNNFTITRNGNTTQGTFSPYGNLWSNYFDGTGDYLSIANNAALTFNTGDFTIEAWIYGSVAFNYNAIVGTGNYTNTSYNMYDFRITNAGTLNLGYGHISNWNNLTGTTVLSTNTWHHVAVTRSGTALRLFVNGVLDATGSSSMDFNSIYATTVGANDQGTFGIADYFNGYISNARIVKGTALYTASFTPPTAPLTAVSGTSLLTCQSNRFIDNSSNNFAITVNGNPSVQRFSPFNPTAPYSANTIGGSGYFDGTGDYLSVPDNAAWYFTGDYTVECWAYWTSTSASEANLIAQSRPADSANQSIDIYSNGTTLYYVYNSGNTSTTIAANQWYHIAMSCTSGTVSCYLNGTRVGTFAMPSRVNAADPLTIGVRTGSGGSGVTGYFTGYLSNIRVVNGTGIYSGTTITVPTTPVTAISNTSLLCNFTNAGIPDAAMQNDLETVGNAQVSTSVKKYGTGSLYFDGSGDYLLAPSNPALTTGTGDFTMEAWVYSAVSGPIVIDGASGSIVSMYISNGGGNRAIIGAANYPTSGVSVIITTSTSVSANTWTHVALVRSSGTLTVYINGTSGGTSANTANSYEQRTIGAVIQAGTPLLFFNGYIDDLRITKGVARYTANFTPPAQALPTN